MQTYVGIHLICKVLLTMEISWSFFPCLMHKNAKLDLQKFHKNAGFVKSYVGIGRINDYGVHCLYTEQIRLFIFYVL